MATAKKTAKKPKLTANQLKQVAMFTRLIKEMSEGEPATKAKKKKAGKSRAAKIKAFDSWWTATERKISKMKTPKSKKKKPTRDPYYMVD